MSAPLYNKDILRLAASIPHHRRLDNPSASVEKRSPTCGSQIIVDVVMHEGRLIALGLDVKACALGQASASLMAKHAIGLSLADIQFARDQLENFLNGTSDDIQFWPGLTILAPARDYPARHAAIRIGFEALAQAAVEAIS